MKEPRSETEEDANRPATEEGKSQILCSFSFNWSTSPELRQVMPHLLQANLRFAEKDFSQPQPFYGPFSGTTWVSRCQKRTSGLYGARED